MKYTLKLFIILFLAAGLWSCGKNEEKNETKNEGNVEQKQNEQVQQNTNNNVQQNTNGNVQQNTNGDVQSNNGEVQNTQQNNQSRQTDTKSKEKTTENEKNIIVKNVKIKAAPDEKKFVNDPKGQWPYDVDASSTRTNRSDDFDLGYSNIQMVGKPNVKAYGDDKNAWSPLEQNKGNEWIRASYKNPVNATEVRVRQNLGPGTISKVELFDDKGQSHLIWEGIDNNKYEANKIEYFVISFSKTPFKVKSVRVTMATDRVPGWNEIDAIQLIGE